jgi:hypothetical protein
VSREVREPRREIDTMKTASMPLDHAKSAYELRFQSLFNEGRALAFPCDAQGHVQIDSLSEKARLNYLYARSLIGREFARPAVQLSDLH